MWTKEGLKWGSLKSEPSFETPSKYSWIISQILVSTSGESLDPFCGIVFTECNFPEFGRRSKIEWGGVDVETPSTLLNLRKSGLVSGDQDGFDAHRFRQDVNSPQFFWTSLEVLNISGNHCLFSGTMFTEMGYCSNKVFHRKNTESKRTSKDVGLWLFSLSWQGNIPIIVCAFKFDIPDCNQKC